MTRTSRHQASADHATGVAARLRDRRERDRIANVYTARAKYPTANTRIGATTRAGAGMYSDSDRAAFAGAVVRVSDPEPAPATFAPGTYPECARCPELYAGCIGNTEIVCYVHARYADASDFGGIL